MPQYGNLACDLGTGSRLTPMFMAQQQALLGNPGILAAMRGFRVKKSEKSETRTTSQRRAAGAGAGAGASVRTADALNPGSTKKLQYTVDGSILHKCAACQVEGNAHQFKYCSGCRSVEYCSEACQRKHWKRVHKHECTRTGPRADASGRQAAIQKAGTLYADNASGGASASQARGSVIISAEASCR